MTNTAIEFLAKHGQWPGEPPKSIGTIAVMRTDEHALLARTGAGTPMGDLLRRFWLPGAVVARD